MKRGLWLAAVMLLPFAAHAQRVSRVNGGQLLGFCSSSDFNKTRNCEAYLDGMADAFAGFAKLGPRDPSGRPLAAIVCIPPNVTGRDLRLNVIRGLQMQPELQGRQAGEAVERILRQSYPCH